jgi:hypothetical protein
MQSFLRRALIVCAFAVTAVPASAQLKVGARALGLGGAYTGISDDIYGTVWNPAGITQLRGFRASLFNAQAAITGPDDLFGLIENFPTDTNSQIEFAKRYASGIARIESTAHFGIGTRNYAFTVLPFANGTVTPRDANGNIGFNFVNFNGEQVPAPGSTATIAARYGFQAIATFGHKLTERTRIGTNLKLINTTPTTFNVAYNANNTAIVSTTVDGPTSNFFAMDFGVLHQHNDEWTLGASLQNFVGPDRADVAPVRLSLGAAYRPLRRGWLAAADLDEIGGATRLNFGAEYQWKSFALRGGVYRGRPTVGVGLFNVLNVAYSPDNTLLSVSLGF